MQAVDRIPWHQPLWQQLQQSWQQQCFPHALLLTGKPGLGKQAFARDLAAVLLCHSKSQTNFTACGHCPGCQLVTSGHHPDMMTLSPEGKAQQIKVDSARAVTAFVQQTAHHDYQVVIIEQAESMNTAAANALLKTLEEPPPNTLLLLLTSEPAKLLATIKSRCRLLNFFNPNAEVAKKWLEGRLDNPGDTAALLKLANGAPLKALHYAETNELEFLQNWLQSWSQLTQRKLPLLTFVKQALNDDVQKPLYYMSIYLEDLIRYQATADMSRLTLTHSQSMLDAVVGRCQMAPVYTLLEKVNQARVNIARIAGLNAQLLLETLLIDWMRVTTNK